MTLATDAHAHVISSDVIRYPISDGARHLAAALSTNAFSVERLLEAMDTEAVQTALLVQRSQFYGFDNSYVCDAVAAAPDRLRAVCAIDARLPDCNTVARDWLQRGATGFRLMQQTRDDDLEWLGGSSAAALWEVCADVGAPLCVHFFPWNRRRGLAMLMEMMSDFPPTPVIVDHLSNCPIDGRGYLQPDELLRRLADESNAHTKITTIPLGTLAKAGLSFDPLIECCRELFGFERILWGSDITQSPGSYHEMKSYLERCVSSLSSEEALNLSSASAIRFYNIEAVVA